MAIVPVPTKFGFTRVNSFQLDRRTNRLPSKFTGQSQTIIYPYAVWMLDANLVEYDGLDAGKIRSFLAQLQGQKNKFRLPVPGYIKSAANFNQTVYLNQAAAARAVSIEVRPFNAGNINGTPLFNEGDFFTINDELKMATAAVAFGPSGSGVNPTFSKAIVSFEPPLRTALGGAQVYIENPTCLMTAAADDVADWSINPPVRQGSRFAAIEAVEI